MEKDIKNLQKELRDVKQLLQYANSDLDKIKIDYLSNKKICEYQENIINKLLNTLQNHKLEKNQFEDKY